MLIRGIVGICLIGSSIGGGALVFDAGHNEEAHERYMSGCIPLVARFSAYEHGYRRVNPPYRKTDVTAARRACEERWAKRRERSAFAALFANP